MHGDGYRKYTICRGCHEEGGTQASLPEPHQPRCRAALPDFQEQAIAILIRAGIRQGCLDRYRREFAHRVYPRISPHILRLTPDISATRSR